MGHLVEMVDELDAAERGLLAVLRRHVPEVASGEVVVKAAGRIPGLGAKVAVEGQRGRNPVAICAGKGNERLMSMRRALGGEALDIVRWNTSDEVLLRRPSSGPGWSR